MAEIQIVAPERRDDAQKLAELWRRKLLRHYGESANVPFVISDSNLVSQEYLQYMEEGEILGLVRFLVYDNNKGRLDRFAVKEFTESVAASFLEEIVRHAKAANLTELYLWALDPEIKFYQGFGEDEVLPGDGLSYQLTKLTKNIS